MQKKYYKDHLIKKKWSQVFLTDQNIIDTIVKTINPKKHQKILEIGPGLGALTQQILNTADLNSLILIERDLNLVNRLIQIFDKKINILYQDIMTTNFFDLSHQVGQKLRLIGNLPYNIATELIIYLFQYINVIYDMHFMFQKEVAMRLYANPDRKEYGRLSIITQYHCKVIPLLTIPSTSFFPIPKVESMVVSLLPHIDTPYPIVNIEKLSFLTKLAFRQRRKTLRNSLSTCFNTKEIIQTGINPELRAENITIDQYCILANMLNINRK
ncbi:16S rRNA (adenine(1518)-N(6)/adenine(1519)-N(6))-dimethyltransferase RsmA [Blochmannia endosymbiont of Camponotus sp. C-046]|uniref:16S rRNA (adenine(1518)-N(6)/adenine(1519)-N(6))- dimethyltransferase RsmA n=1 Tax=Blochmannia endosymbiont of Camponotus sp. C-046 TaxID=2945589 RepID=UPI0020248762|nr:16S rRNA (adenine(1518)-N(6)/adenine(1519)-N(6))-dimethyltransferase RsmA [Blochmannia endosymbiont of Camponotus sp. C-046]URJ28584.1 16S rRNA (adenine(1518)-N(6)/adenine(1519)-N(6))-dimethyltransferase RsmA [Blochmannia endosymbiont of Camponotus sp. C-046]